ncbi:hypothetical protein [Actinophytocola oryzae]|uniref:Uncharacterized protein n=1 Tax=Actinophytocola oryzae TaxID=502181 RepID=A0A4R7VHQ9_9PSEU|nr:hypothetical protein [Actinophytocola oryzae]TDV48894.1 hypothetical protein CLV71_108255 [Actinophytocola oryzae]
MSHLVFPDDGIVAVWDAAPFAHVEDHESWAAALADPAESAIVLIEAGDGPCEVEVRVGGGAPSAAISGPHPLVSTGAVRMSGPHAVGGVLWDNTVELEVPPGRYTLTAHRPGGTRLVVVLSPT